MRIVKWEYVRMGSLEVYFQYYENISILEVNLQFVED